MIIMLLYILKYTLHCLLVKIVAWTKITETRTFLICYSNVTSTAGADGQLSPQDY